VIALMGLPGAGKGTQAQLLARHGWSHINVGGLVRSEVAAGTGWGERAAAVMRRGDLVPSQAVQDLLAHELSGWKLPVVIDGYPRRLDEANSLPGLFRREIRLIYFLFDIPFEVAVLRLARRLVCGTCEYVARRGGYNTCPRCSGDLVVREDDNSREAVQRRLRNFERETVPLLEHYRSRGELEVINALPDEVQIYAELTARIERRCNLLV
jgi:adenylate kinase